MRDPAPGFEAPPPRLVEEGRQRLGRFHGPPGRVNLLDASYLGLPRALRRWRLKEWQAIQVAAPDLSAAHGSPAGWRSTPTAARRRS